MSDAEIFQIKRLDVIPKSRYNHGHCVGVRFKGKKVSSGHRGTYGVDIQIARSEMEITDENIEFANRVLDKIIANINNIVVSAYAQEFSCYHNAANVYVEVAEGFEMFKSEWAQARFDLSTARKLDQVLPDA